MTTLCRLAAVLALGVAQAQEESKETPVGMPPLGLYVYARNGDKLALARLTSLADLGDTNAQYFLGDLYSAGEGVPKDAAQAVQWFRRAGDQGDVVAQYNLGLMYGEGEGVPKNAAQTVQWYRKAADQGFADAQSNLGALYYRGEGVPKDLVLSYMWRNLAAAQGNEIAKTARDSLEKDLTPAQIAEAQKLSREWKPKK